MKESLLRTDCGNWDHQAPWMVSSWVDSYGGHQMPHWRQVNGTKEFVPVDERIISGGVELWDDRLAKIFEADFGVHELSHVPFERFSAERDFIRIRVHTSRGPSERRTTSVEKRNTAWWMREASLVAAFILVGFVEDATWVGGLSRGTRTNRLGVHGLTAESRLWWEVDTSSCRDVAGRHVRIRKRGGSLDGRDPRELGNLVQELRLGLCTGVFTRRGRGR